MLVRRFSLGLLVIILLIFQITIFRKMELWGMRPDSAVIMLVYIGLALGPVAGSLFGFLLGVASLSLLSTSMTSMPLAATVVGFLVGKYATKIMYESYLVQMVIIFISVLILDIINFAWADASSLAWSVLRFSVGTAAYTAVVGIVIVVIIERLVGLRLVSQR